MCFAPSLSSNIIADNVFKNEPDCYFIYGVATISKLLKIMVFLQKSPIKETMLCKRDL